MRRPDLRPKTLPWLLGKIALAVFFRAYLRLRVEGEENVPSHGAFLLISNHQSNLDPLAIGYACHREVNFLSKQEIFKIPIVSYFARQWGTIPFDRDATDTSAVRAALGVLQRKKILGIFPEGTRSASGELQPFRSGAAKMALRFAVPIIPVAISGSRAAMPRGALFIRPARVTVRFGAPFDLSGSSPTRGEGLAEATATIRSRIEALMTDVPSVKA